MRPSNLISLAAALVLSGAAALAEAPRRVISLNLCTDQLAMLLADPGQLVSVTILADDPRSSVLAEQGAKLHKNNSTAEDVVLQKPDLVLGGAFNSGPTISMLRRLGYRVEIFQPAGSLDAARANILRMGVLLGHEERAARVVAQFDARLAALQAEVPTKRPRVAVYWPLGTTAGRETLPGDILDAAGMDNIADEKGLPFGGKLPLEELVFAKPDIVMITRPYGGHARATELLQHPAVKASGKLVSHYGGPHWICGTPYLADAVAEMVALRQAWEAGE